MLSDELQYFIDHQDELVQSYEGKILVIRNKQVVRIYDDVLSAYFGAKAEHEPGTFLIQRCIPGPEAYTVTISSIQMQV